MKDSLLEMREKDRRNEAIVVDWRDVKNVTQMWCMGKCGVGKVSGKRKMRDNGRIEKDLTSHFHLTLSSDFPEAEEFVDIGEDDQASCSHSSSFLSASGGTELFASCRTNQLRASIRSNSSCGSSPGKGVSYDRSLV